MLKALATLTSMAFIGLGIAMGSGTPAVAASPLSAEASELRGGTPPSKVCVANGPGCPAAGGNQCVLDKQGLCPAKVCGFGCTVIARNACVTGTTGPSCTSTASNNCGDGSKGTCAATVTSSCICTPATPTTWACGFYTSCI